MNSIDEDHKEKCDFLFNVIGRYDHYIATTNFKIGLMFSFVSAATLGLSIRAVSVNPLHESCGILSYITLILILVTIVFSLVTAVFLLKAVFPSLKNIDKDKSLIFFGDVSGMIGGKQEYYEKVYDLTQHELLKDLSYQVFILAKITNYKFKVLQYAVSLIMYIVVPCLTLPLILIIT
ncbi:Pycsar system effector family protein [Cobetia amphilecti]|uniref:Pycsar system effector family protein n=1 Tax=Cobetia amphilecti TaxID=1055104 RepID=UPI0026E190EF|nr:Pycsar system effector family protein [Cobetia amphilecti]MDO6814792.1 DUF5706 domain-containing protein [Cobetia amphilecti]